LCFSTNPIVSVIFIRTSWLLAAGEQPRISIHT